MKIVALAFAAYRTGIAAISVDRAKPALRNVSFIGADDLQVIPGDPFNSIIRGFPTKWHRLRPRR